MTAAGTAVLLGTVLWLTFFDGSVGTKWTAKAAPSAQPPASPAPQGEQSPSPSPSPSSARPRGGKPSSANTGVPSGTQLTIVTADQVFATPGQVISDKDFRGFVKVTGHDITFRNSIFRGRATNSNASLLNTQQGVNTTVIDSEFVPANPSATIDAIWAKNSRFTRVNVHGAVDGFKAGGNVIIEDSYIHDLSWFASDPNQGGGATHNDGVQSFEGDSKITLRRNNIDLSSSKQANAAWQNSATDVHIENNWLDGGGCTLNFAHRNNQPLTGIYVVGNRFGRHSFYSCPILISTKTTLSQNSNNVWDDTGKPIPRPQQHD